MASAGSLMLDPLLDTNADNPAARRRPARAGCDCRYIQKTRNPHAQHNFVAIKTAAPCRESPDLRSELFGSQAGRIHRREKAPHC